MNRLDPDSCLIPQEYRAQLREALPPLSILPSMSETFRRFFDLVHILQKNPRWCEDLTVDELPSGEFVKLSYETFRGGSYWSDYWWLHGGTRGLKPRDYLLPASVTGLDPRGEGDRFPRRKDFVFITRYHCFANMYACRLIDGVIYEVAPDGPVRPLPSFLRALMILREEPNLRLVPTLDLIPLMEGFTCARAQVIASKERSTRRYLDDQAGRPRSYA
ncbi:MAG: hypothetical protein ACK4VZ_02460 [Paracoccaceae bacterium]